MMERVLRVDGNGANPYAGTPVLDWPKAIWNGGMLAGTLLVAIPLFNWPAFALFLTTTWLSLLIGHSVGMHRMMIHRSFSSPRWFERVLIYIGTLVGVSGPSGIIRIHDVRDWAQRQPYCHDFFAHRRGFWRDLSWNLAYRFQFEQPPAITVEPHFAANRFYRFLDVTWRWHQLPLALALYVWGGWSFVAWGVCARVFISAAGHWSVTYFCHNPGPGRWWVQGAGIQASNLKGMGLVTYGECWHNNHHAFPESAQIGLEPGQVDPGWWLIQLLAKIGLADNIGRPRTQVDRDDLRQVDTIAPKSPNQP